MVRRVGKRGLAPYGAALYFVASVLYKEKFKVIRIISTTKIEMVVDW